MSFRIGDRYGRIYDYFRYYVPFRMKYGITFNTPHIYREIYKNTTMYDKPGFIPKPGEIVFDVGSQYGDFALLWEKRNHATVYVFEALPTNFYEIQKNIMLNKSAIHSVLEFVGNGTSIEYEVLGNMASRKEGSVLSSPTLKLDDFVYKHQVKPDIIKIDVEGFEYEVLEGLDKTLKEISPKIIMETHSRELRLKCNKFLEDHGYELFYTGRYGSTDNWMDEVVNLFYGRVWG